MKIHYTPANGEEFLLFLDRNCHHCALYDPAMVYGNRDGRFIAPRCGVLRKLLDQTGFTEAEAPDVYAFDETELAVDGYPPKCMERRE